MITEDLLAKQFVEYLEHIERIFGKRRRKLVEASFRAAIDDKDKEIRQTQWTQARK